MNTRQAILVRSIPVARAVGMVRVPWPAPAALRPFPASHG